jgi:hypothetical protein
MKEFRSGIFCMLAFAVSAVSAEEWQVPRTEHGDPDLQGLWTSATITGLERPANVDTLVLTEEQARLWERRSAAAFASIDDIPEEGVQQGQDVGGYNSFWMDPGTRIMRVNGELRSSILVQPENGRLPFRLGARAKVGEFMLRIANGMDGPEQRPLGERCIVGFGSTGGPPMLPVLYNNNYQIVQSPGHVLIHVEMNHDARIIRLNTDHLPENVRPWLGDSVGHFEGDTLVVETTNFNPGQSFRASIRHQFYMTRDAVVTERFTMVNDPGAYTEPWSGEMALRATPGPIYEYACHEANYAMRGILAGARMDENPPDEDSD